MNGPVTVVIPARDAAATLEQQLVALDRQLGDVQFEVVLVDNGSSDDTAEIARQFPATRFTLRVVDEPRAGINYSRNAGIRAAADGAVLLCDADDEAEPSWVQAMVDALEPGHWVAGVVDYTTLNSARTRLQWGAPTRSGCVVVEPFVDRTFGGCCGFWKSMWAGIGEFDVRLSGIGGDETEFFFRAYREGYRQTWAPDAVLGYRLRAGARNMARQRFRQGRNQIRMTRISGSQFGGPLLTPAATCKAIAKLVVVSPKYAFRAASRYEWLGAMSRHLGRLAGYRERA